MTVRVYRSTDPGAPNSLTGQLGSLIPVLDACLVNGYGSGPDLKVAAGWTKEYAATNKAVYRGGSGSQLFFRIDDANPFGGSQNQIAAIRGYESMTGIDTGSGPFPLASTHPNGCQWPKHTLSGNATARAWTVVADDKFCWFLCNRSGDDSNSVHVGELFFFGDILSDKSGDPWHAVVGAGSSSSAAPIMWQLLSSALTNGAATSSTAGVICRDHLGTPATPHSFSGYARAWDTGAPGNSTNVPFPDPVSGGMLWEKEVPVSAAGVLRGKLPGIAYPLHAAPLAPGDTFTADGKTWLVVHPVRTSGGSTQYQCFLDITGPWE